MAIAIPATTTEMVIMLIVKNLNVRLLVIYLPIKTYEISQQLRLEFNISMKWQTLIILNIFTN